MHLLFKSADFLRFSKLSGIPEGPLAAGARATNLPAHCFACILGTPSLTAIRPQRRKLLLGKKVS